MFYFCLNTLDLLQFGPSQNILLQFNTEGILNLLLLNCKNITGNGACILQLAWISKLKKHFRSEA